MMFDVLIYGLSFFCCKFVVMNYLFWLPSFLGEVFDMDNTRIANFASLFDTGTMFGAFALGWISDKCY